MRSSAMDNYRIMVLDLAVVRVREIINLGYSHQYLYIETTPGVHTPIFVEAGEGKPSTRIRAHQYFGQLNCSYFFLTNAASVGTLTIFFADNPRVLPIRNEISPLSEVLRFEDVERTLIAAAGGSELEVAIPTLTEAEWRVVKEVGLTIQTTQPSTSQCLAGLTARTPTTGGRSLIAYVVPFTLTIPAMVVSPADALIRALPLASGIGGAGTIYNPGEICSLYYFNADPLVNAIISATLTFRF